MGTVRKVEEGLVVGNTYDKYESRNPIARVLVRGYLRCFDELVRTADASTVLEVGCGEGELSLRVAGEGREILGTDVSAMMIAEARERAARRGIGMRFEQADLFDLDPARARYDLVLCCEVLEHLRDPVAAIAHLARLSRQYLILSVPREPVWRLLNIVRGRYLRDLGNTPGHLQHWSTAAFRHMLAGCLGLVELRTPFPWSMALCRLPSSGEARGQTANGVSTSEG